MAGKSTFGSILACLPMQQPGRLKGKQRTVETDNWLSATASLTVHRGLHTAWYVLTGPFTRLNQQRQLSCSHLVLSSIGTKWSRLISSRILTQEAASIPENTDTLPQPSYSFTSVASCMPWAEGWCSPRLRGEWGHFSKCECARRTLNWGWGPLAGQ